jgi:DNA-nicking Smr family endonuclease
MHLLDDGHTVELDLHRARVAEAARLFEEAAVLAAERGRQTLRVVHGRSTTDPRGEALTIKRVVHDVLASGYLDEYVASWLDRGGATLVGLVPAPEPDARRIRLTDLP